MRTYDITNNGVTYRLDEASEGGYVASVPELPGCLSEGATIDEALANIREALALYIECALEQGLPLPERFRTLPAEALA
jgi:predicted RNase H-like HicB family nuclease